MGIGYLEAGGIWLSLRDICAFMIQLRPRAVPILLLANRGVPLHTRSSVLLFGVSRLCIPGRGLVVASQPVWSSSAVLWFPFFSLRPRGILCLRIGLDNRRQVLEPLETLGFAHTSWQQSVVAVLGFLAAHSVACRP